MTELIHAHGISGGIPVLFEDNHLLIVQKPANLLTQADHTGDEDLLTLCRNWLGHKYNKPGNVFLGLVHRLDRPVGGVIALAKTSRAASRLSEQIRNRTFRKQYLAVVHGKIPPNGVLVHYLLKDRSANRVTVSRQNHKAALKAELSYIARGRDRQKNLSLAEIHLITGRPHQIRVQFSAEGYPLFGDTKYGRMNTEAQKPALFATKIIFRHPAE